MNRLPKELAEARIQRTEAWNRYMQVIDRDHTAAEYNEALRLADQAEESAAEWYRRWQAVGGTSDIESIVEAETKNVSLDFSRVFSGGDYPVTLEQFTSAQYGQAGEELGTYTIISGGEVIEFGSPQWFDGIEPIEF